MPLLSLLIAVELIIGLVVAPLPPPRPHFKHFSYQAGLLLAEEAGPAADSSGEDTGATDTGGSDSSGTDSGSVDNGGGTDNAGGEANPSQETGQDNAGQEQANPGSENTSPEQPNTPEQANENPSIENPPAENQPTENIQTESAPEEQNANVPVEEFSNTESVALTDAGTNTNPENIDQTLVDKAQTEENELAQTETPAEAVPLLIEFANDKIDDVGALIEIGDFTSANFTIQRINDQVDQALADIGSLNSQESAPLKQELVKFSEQADAVFRWQQLVVPENLEQDFEISRGQFLNIEQTK